MANYENTANHQGGLLLEGVYMSCIDETSRMIGAYTRLMSSNSPMDRGAFARLNPFAQCMYARAMSNPSDAENPL